jgi:hypothetical protein
MINSVALFWEDKLLGKKLFNAVFESGLTVLTLCIFLIYIKLYITTAENPFSHSDRE